MKYSHIAIFLGLMQIFVIGCSNQDEVKELKVYKNTVINEVDRLQQSADVWQQKLANPQITKDESIEYSAAMVTAYEDIVRYIELQPQPRTIKVQQLHNAFLSAMKELLVLQKLQYQLWTMMSQNIDPPQEFLDKGMKQKILAQAKINQYKELLENR